MASFSEFFGGTPAGVQRVPSGFGQGQVKGLEQLLSSGMKNMQNPTQGFNPIAQNAMSQFQQQIAPQLAERFAGADALGSSGFAGALASAGTGLAERLAAMQAQFGQNQQQFGLQQAQSGLQPLFQNFERQGQSGLLQQLSPILGQLLAGGVGAYMGGGGQDGEAGPGGWAQILPMLAKILMSAAI